MITNGWLMVGGRGAVPTACRRFGFTLIELLVVIAVIGVLAGIIFPLAAKAHRDAEVGATTMRIAAAVGALERFQGDIHRYPWPAPSEVPAKGALILPEDVLAELRNDPVLAGRISTQEDYLAGSGLPPSAFKAWVKDSRKRSSLVDSWGRELRFRVRVDDLKAVAWSVGRDGIDQTANAADGSDIDRSAYPEAKYPLERYPTSYYWYPKKAAGDDLGSF